MPDLLTMSTLFRAVPSTYFIYKIGSGMKEDRIHGTSRNTVKKAVVSAAQAFALAAGYDAGIDVSRTLEFLAPISTGVLGGLLLGCYVGSLTGSAVEQLFNSFNYNIKRKTCSGCHQNYIFRMYKGDTNETMCHDCDVILKMLRVHLELYRERGQQ